MNIEEVREKVVEESKKIKGREKTRRIRKKKRKGERKTEKRNQGRKEKKTMKESEKEKQHRLKELRESRLQVLQFGSGMGKENATKLM